MGKYDDMLNMPHHVSKRHPQMSPENRAAQFAAFAALSGYEEEIKQAGKRAEIEKYENGVTGIEPDTI